MPWESPVVVSSDDHILDGHHRWAATKLWNKERPKDKKDMEAYRVPIPMKRLLKITNAFTDAVDEVKRKGKPKPEQKQEEKPEPEQKQEENPEPEEKQEV